jgi:hypothetical protein
VEDLVVRAAALDDARRLGEVNRASYGEYLRRGEQLYFEVSADAPCAEYAADGDEPVADF